MTKKLQISDFEPHLNTTFRIELSDSSRLDAVLVEVVGIGSDDKNKPESNVRDQPFSLLFKIFHKQSLEQQIYRMTHDKMEPIDIFLVPLGPGQEGMQYEAVFN